MTSNLRSHHVGGRLIEDRIARVAHKYTTRLMHTRRRTGGRFSTSIGPVSPAIPSIDAGEQRGTQEIRTRAIQESDVAKSPGIVCESSGDTRRWPK